jgi:hypothetical protein
MPISTFSQKRILALTRGEKNKEGRSFFLLFWPVAIGLYVILRYRPNHENKNPKHTQNSTLKAK